MALRAKQNRWGQQGLLLFIMAPAPAYGVSDQELRSLTEGNLIVQVYENDDRAPHHIAEDIYGKIGIPYENKFYYYVEGGDHSEPTERSVDNYDRLAIWTPLDALMDYTFDMDQPNQGKAFALDGEGDHYRTTILDDPNAPQGGGRWSDSNGWLRWRDDEPEPDNDSPRWSRFWIRNRR